MSRDTNMAVILLALLWCCAIHASSEVDYSNRSVYRLHFTSAQQAHIMRLWLATHNQVEAWSDTDVVVPPEAQEEFLQFLNTINLPHERVIDNIGRLFEDEQYSLLEPTELKTDKYYTYVEMQHYLTELAAEFPEAVKIESIGESFHNRNLTMVTISGKRYPYTVPILIEAGNHAAEWVSSAMALYIISQITQNVTSDYYSDLDKTEWHIIPLINPDGYEYSRLHDRAWRKTRSRNVGNCRKGGKYFHGADIDRNFDIHWNTSGVKWNRCSSFYPGKAPFSEKETVAFRDYVISHPFRLFISLQASGRILYPWAYTNEPYNVTGRSLQTLQDALKYTEEKLKKEGKEPYEIGQFGVLKALASGTSMDWVTSNTDVPWALTMKLPGGKIRGFELPVDELHDALQSSLPAVLALAEKAVEYFWLA